MYIIQDFFGTIVVCYESESAAELACLLLNSGGSRYMVVSV